MFHEFKENKIITSLVLSADCKWLYSGYENGDICKWNTVAGDNTYCFKGHTKTIESLVLSFDGVWLYSGSYDRTIRRWNTITDQTELITKSHNVRTIVITLDGTWLYFGFNDTVCRFNTVNSQIEHVFKCQDWISTININGLWLYVKTVENTIYKLCIETSLCTHMFKCKARNGLNSIKISDGHVYSYYGDRIYHADINNEKLINVFNGHKRFVYAIVLSFDGKWLYSGGWDCTIRKWNIETGKITWTIFCKAPVCALTLSNDNKWLYAGIHGKATLIKIDLNYNEKVKSLIYNWLVQSDVNIMCDCDNTCNMICDYLDFEKVSNKRKLNSIS